MKKHNEALTRLKALVQRAGTNKAAAAELDCTGAFVGDLLKGRRLFSDRMLAKLKLKRTVVDAEKVA